MFQAAHAHARTHAHARALMYALTHALTHAQVSEFCTLLMSEVSFLSCCSHCCASSAARVCDSCSFAFSEDSSDRDLSRSSAVASSSETRLQTYQALHQLERESRFGTMHKIPP